MMDALGLLRRYDGSDADFYAAVEVVPLEHVVPEGWRDAVLDPDGASSRGRCCPPGRSLRGEGS
ncbi:hypothetical protein ABZ470_16630 [Streptosporangium sp. NPDC020072]|uniref:hypothetical protein n=1 Tax=Streptosporangium sp. NPDC020072 TaxID=3154788 RepID=UPI003435A2B3